MVELMLKYYIGRMDGGLDVWLISGTTEILSTYTRTYSSL